MVVQKWQVVLEWDIISLLQIIIIKLPRNLSDIEGLVGEPFIYFFSFQRSYRSYEVRTSQVFAYTMNRDFRELLFECTHGYILAWINKSSAKRVASYEYCEHFNVAQLMIFGLQIFILDQVGTYDDLGFLLAGKIEKREPWFCCLLHLFIWVYFYQFVLCGQFVPGHPVAQLRMTRLMSGERCIKVRQNQI